ncbi:hypothetical protein GCM10010259_08280 [Streptomyces daghestanicus]|uniref:Uncharacterized protein n=1 Tax=Streptomyces daghestanicus TaxID=66885 RepID=A0ABQ3Q4Q2_9ACTN|nr:hypothetical protein GCM10010259_08280 [Streptomyces daghestanicus]GHI32200.1 hypothetical protein Sdagh_39300 [Streptomyces daghestanicus]
MQDGTQPPGVGVTGVRVRVGVTRRVRLRIVGLRSVRLCHARDLLPPGRTGRTRSLSPSAREAGVDRSDDPRVVRRAGPEQPER